MLIKLLLVFSLALVALSDFAPPKRQVNLDLPPAERWVEIFKEFKTPIMQIAEAAGSKIPTMEYYLLSTLLRWRFLTVEHSMELAGACKAIGLDYNTAVILNFMYELNAHCTSIVARTESGKMIHGRNLDYSYGAIFKDLTAEIEFIRDGKVLYTTVATVGGLGAVTGMRVGAWSVSID
jgi:hypothetical protein